MSRTSYLWFLGFFDVFLGFLENFVDILNIIIGGLWTHSRNRKLIQVSNRRKNSISKTMRSRTNPHHPKTKLSRKSQQEEKKTNRHQALMKMTSNPAYLIIILSWISCLRIGISYESWWAKLRERSGSTNRNFLKKRKRRNVYFISYVDMKSHVGDNSVPICADVTRFDFDLLAQKQLEVAQR